MKSIRGEVRRRQAQRIERRARPALPRVIEHHVIQVMPRSSRISRGASWVKSGRMNNGWLGRTRWGENFGTIR